MNAAAEGDFVIAFYNPVSKRRDWQLGKAREILLTERPESTPVVIGWNLGREGERITHTTEYVLRDVAAIGEHDSLFLKAIS